MLEVRDLHVTYRPVDGPVHAVRGVDLDIGPGDTVGIVGESGSGKSSVIKAVLGLLPSGTRVTGRVRFDGASVDLHDEDVLRRIRGRRIGLVPQGAMSALNPVQTVGDHIAESLVVHRGMATRDLEDAIAAHLEAVGIDPARASAYPHEFSGGMRQRVVVALTLASAPDVVIADEPTVGLDAATQATALRVLREAVVDGAGGQSTPPALILVSHDLDAVLGTCDRVLVMYAGRLVERGQADRLRLDASHPYSIGLMAARPTVGTDAAWRAIPGHAPDPRESVAGCAFAPRCFHADDRCGAEVPELRPARGTEAACHLLDLVDGGTVPPLASATVTVAPRATASDGASIVSVEGVAKRYAGHRGDPVDALDGVDLSIRAGEIVGLLGASGSGKSTLASCLLRMVDPDEGTIEIDGVDVLDLRGRDLRAMRRRIGLVQQDPYDALHPAMTVRSVVGEPLRVGRGWWRGAARDDDAVAEAVRMVGLEPTSTLLDSRPGLLSGGQRQRLAIARAIVTEPVLLIADEPTSMLDVSVRAGVAAQLRAVRDATGMAVLFITHDIAEAAVLCDRLVVMDQGRIVDEGAPVPLFESASHPATRALIPPTPALDGATS